MESRSVLNAILIHPFQPPIISAAPLFRQVNLPKNPRSISREKQHLPKLLLVSKHKTGYTFFVIDKLNVLLEEKA